ncbi:hypothetical protein MKW94_019181, partial [Papaver nudicaule]|nr:hypothetical protein [Papaver nudicaule]
PLHDISQSMRKEIAKLLENRQEATARIRVEHIIREENMMAAQEILELFSELVAVRLPIIETQRECPLDLKEAISTICFAAPRCADLPELLQVQMLFASKYGKEFITAASELMPDCGVNRQVIELLSVRAPPAEKKLKLLKEIAEEHNLEWDPAASETEYFKSHEDLLKGSNINVHRKISHRFDNKCYLSHNQLQVHTCMKSSNIISYKFRRTTNSLIKLSINKDEWDFIGYRIYLLQH